MKNATKNFDHFFRKKSRQNLECFYFHKYEGKYGFIGFQWKIVIKMEISLLKKDIFEMFWTNMDKHLQKLLFKTDINQ